MRRLAILPSLAAAPAAAGPSPFAGTIGNEIACQVAAGRQVDPTRSDENIFVRGDQVESHEASCRIPAVSRQGERCRIDTLCEFAGDSWP